MSFLGLDGALSFLEEKTIDARLEFRGPIPSPVKVCYVNVDPDSISEIGNFPWNRAIFARALDALFERGKVRAVGMDFVFGRSGLPQLGRAEAEAGSIELGKSIQKNRYVVLAATYRAQMGVLGKANRSFPFLFQHRKPEETDLPELPDFPVVGPTWGTVGLIDAGEQLRWIPAFAPTEYKSYLAMAIQLALAYNRLEESAVEIEPDRILVRDDSRQLYEIPLKLGQIIEPNWFSPWDSNPSASLIAVLEFDRLSSEGTDEEKALASQFFERFEDAVVLIGATDPLLGDNSPAPMSGSYPVPRVSVHGNLFKTIVSGQHIIRPPAWVSALLIAGLGLGAAMLSVMRNQFSGPGKLLAAGLTIGYIAGAFVLFVQARVLVPIVAPVGAVLTCTFLAVLRQLTIEEQQRRRIKQLFGSYVSSAVVNEMVEKSSPPQTGGAEVEITAFFSDIVAFSPLAENLSAKDLVELMCQYLGECTEAIIGAQGTLDKYVGDAILAMFGAPLACRDHAAAGCRAAIALQAAQAHLRQRWTDEARWPEAARKMQTRVGLHTGLAIVGNIGSELRFNYTMMGDTVNLAQRVESAASHYGAGILVSGDTQAAAFQSDPGLVFLAIDRATVPGRTHPVELWELLGSGDDARKLHAESIGLYEEARRHYMRGSWREASDGFLRASNASDPHRKKRPAQVMAERCMRMIGRPPIDNFEFPLSKEAGGIFGENNAES
ncbi:MAG: adenylate/guanylate cyclase domain-containing protein [Verrucomicrobiae bacterium]